MKKLVNNYENRIKNYVLKMAENPIIIKNNNKIQSLLTFSQDYNLIKKNFRIKNYIPDKERLDEILLHKAILDKYLEKIGKINNIRELKYKKRKEAKLIQPSMRYTGRTDLERIYDVIRKKENYYTQKKAIIKQLKKIELKAHSMEDNNYDEYDMQHEHNLINNKDINFSTNSIISNKMNKEKKNNLNKKIYLINLLTNSHNNENSYFKKANQKTEFRAMENLKMFKTSTLNHNIFNKIKLMDEENQKYLKNNHFNEELDSEPSFKLKIKEKNLNSKIGLRKNPIFRKINSVDNLNFDNNIKNNIFNNTYATSFNKNKNNKIKNNIICIRNNSYEELRQYNIYENKNDLNEFNITKEVVNMNPLLYNINRFNNKKKDIYKIRNRDHLADLKKIAFEKYENLKKSFDEKEQEQEASKNNYEDLKKEENIYIDGKGFKKTEIDKIAEKLLKLYN